jgi:hypothetical protein
LDKNFIQIYTNLYKFIQIYYINIFKKNVIILIICIFNIILLILFFDKTKFCLLFTFLLFYFFMRFLRYGAGGNLIYETAIVYRHRLNKLFLELRYYSIILLSITNNNRNFISISLYSHIDYAFLSIEHIMRDVNNGWLIRYTHLNGASFFSYSIYTYVKRHLLWCSYIYQDIYYGYLSVIIFFLMIVIALWDMFYMGTNEFLGSNSNNKFIFCYHI